CNYLSSNLFSELVIPVNDEIKRIKVINDSSRGFFVISSEESDELSEKYWHGDWKLFKHPEKLVDKIGYFSKALKLIFMFHFDPDQVWTVKRFWGEKYVSLELIFNPVVLSPEGSITYNFAVSLSSESSLIKVLEKSASMPNIVSF
ncbi:MAG: hypothetical protein QXS21_05565, partial [Thermoproteota archaeon]